VFVAATTMQATQGGSTLTQQLVRTTLITNEKQLRRKLREVFLALSLENELSKQEIFTLFVNTQFLGQRSYGFAAAAETTYFPIIHCATSFGHYKETRQQLLHDPELRAQVRKILGKLGKTRAPTAAILTSGAGIMLAAGVSKFTPLAYNYLFGVALFGAIVVWIMILLSHLSFRRRHGAAHLPVRMPFFPVMQLAGLALLAAVLITMGLDTEFWNISWIVGVPWLVLLSAAYFIWRARR